MRFKPRYNQYELRFLQVLVHRDKLFEIIKDMYYTFLEHQFFLGSAPRSDGEEWLKGIITDYKEDEKNEG